MRQRYLHAEMESCVANVMTGRIEVTLAVRAQEVQMH